MGHVYRTIDTNCRKIENQQFEANFPFGTLSLHNSTEQMAVQTNQYQKCTLVSWWVLVSLKAEKGPKLGQNRSQNYKIVNLRPIFHLKHFNSINGLKKWF